MKIFSLEKTQKHNIYKILGIKFKFKVDYDKKNNNRIVSKSDNNILKSPPLYSITGQNNTVAFDEAILNKLSNINIKILGSSNKIIIGNLQGSFHINITIYGDNNSFEIRNSNQDIDLSCQLGQKVNSEGANTNCSFFMDENCFVGGANIRIYPKNNSVRIGKDCMISDCIEIQAGDGHMIIDNNTGEMLNNKENHIEIADHVWIGRHSTIFKNAKIKENCIVGLKSFVLHEFTEQNCILVGSPAKIIKRNINWKKENFNYL